MSPLNTPDLHLSSINAQGITTTPSKACFINKPIASVFAFSASASEIKPILFKYSGVIDRVNKSPNASWKPSLAPP